MNEEATLKVLGVLIAAYPRQELSDATIDVYLAALSDIDAQILRAAALDHITKSKWFPTVAELREQAVNLAGANDEAAAYDGWKQVLDYTSARKPITDPIAIKAIEALGGLKAFGMSHVDEQPSWRMRFIQAYNSYKSREINDTFMLPAVRDTREALRAGEIRGKIALLAGKLSA